MRFLCFHGKGSNSQIMETQIAALCQELDSFHEYDYVEGVIAVPLDPELRPFFPMKGEYFDYFSPDSVESVKQALDDLSAFIESNGPYDGIIAFSQGGCLASTFLIQQTILHPMTPLPFKCAIFLSSINPTDPRALDSGHARFLDPQVEGDQMLAGLPTAHIWGRNDTLWANCSETLYGLCDPELRLLLLHDEGHTVPGVRAQEYLLASVRLINRTIEKAEMPGHL